MKALKPRGFKLIAKTQMPGTGGVEASAYYNSDTQEVWFLVIDPATEKELPFGPIAVRCLGTLSNTIYDVMEMAGKHVTYLDENE